MKLANHRFMDLTARPVLPIELRAPRLEQDVWQPIKAAVHAESGGRCFYCSTYAGPCPVCDHLTPIARGGTNDRDNLVTACNSCNARKGMLTLDEFNRKRELRAA